MGLKFALCILPIVGLLMVYIDAREINLSEELGDEDNLTNLDCVSTHCKVLKGANEVVNYKPAKNHPRKVEEVECGPGLFDILVCKNNLPGGVYTSRAEIRQRSFMKF